MSGNNTSKTVKWNINTLKDVKRDMLVTNVDNYLLLLSLLVTYDETIREFFLGLVDHKVIEIKYNQKAWVLGCYPHQASDLSHEAVRLHKSFKSQETFS